MFKLICLTLVVVVALAEKPLYGSPECAHALTIDCSTFPDEPVCTLTHDVNITYANSCEFAQALCTHHGHQVHATHPGPC